MQVLQQVWALADVNKDNYLSSDEFCVAFHLIVLVSIRGMKLPLTLPSELAHSAGMDSGGSSKANALASTLSAAMGIHLNASSQSEADAQQEATRRKDQENAERQLASERAKKMEEERIQEEKHRGKHCGSSYADHLGSTWWETPPWHFHALNGMSSCLINMLCRLLIHAQHN